MGKRIAIIGSGMAGLAAGWYLGRDHEITLFERQPKIGIGAHSVELEGGCVDVPLRVLYPGYYPELFSVLRQSGVAVEALDASLSFSEAGAPSYFRYHNVHWGRRTVPFVSLAMLLAPLPRRIIADLAKFMLKVPAALSTGKLQGCSIDSYLRDEGYSAAFIDKFLIPCFAGINTVSNTDVRAYPAEVIAQYFSRGFIFSKVYRAVGGATAISAALSARIAHIMLGAHIASIQRVADGVRIFLDNNTSAHFDAVVFATQANQVVPLLTDASPEERRILGGFRYGTVRVLMHHDTTLAPPSRSDWAPVNYMLCDCSDRPMVTIWVNKLLPAYESELPTFQTINPTGAIDDSLIVAQADLQRPTVDSTSASLIQQIAQINAEPGRRVFFCGSYAATGIPLLESATVSAQLVSRIIQAQPPIPSA